MTCPAIDARLVLPMAAQAPSHFNLLRASDARHTRHVPMAGSAGKSGTDMHLVREVYMVRYTVDPDPGNGLFALPEGHKFFDLRGVLCNEQMAGPAIRYRWDPGDRGCRGMTMTEKARYAVVSSVHLMAEGDRLKGGAVTNVQWKAVQERQNGEKHDRRNGQPADQPR